MLPSFSAAGECILVDRTFFIELLCFNVPVQRYPRALRWGWNLGALQPSLTEHHLALIKRVSSPEYSWPRAHPSNLLLFAKELIYYLWSRSSELFPIMMIMLATDPGSGSIRYGHNLNQVARWYELDRARLPKC